MYKKIEPALRITSLEASVRYPDEFILMRMDSFDPSNDMGTALYLGDDYDELFDVVMNLDDRNNCGVTEGLNHLNTLGGLVIGE